MWTWANTDGSPHVYLVEALAQHISFASQRIAFSWRRPSNDIQALVSFLAFPDMGSISTS